MAHKVDFNAEEWTLIVEGPSLAGMHVLVAEPGGTAQERVAMAESYVEARSQCGPSNLLDEIVAEPPQVAFTHYGAPEAAGSTSVRNVALERLRSAASILKSKATAEDVAYYRRYVLGVARHVAEAHKEGGFLGFGGTRVTEREHRALEEVSAAFSAEPERRT